MKNIICFSLWGNDPMYWVGARKNIDSVNLHFPNWFCRFYVDENCDGALINSLNGKNVEIVKVKSEDSFHGMFWRFWGSLDEDVDIFLSRDCDSRFSEREIAAIKEWLGSDKDFHIMRDHPYHTVPVLGGMWGCRNGLMRKINLGKLISEWSQFHRKGIDQDFLGQMIYPKVFSCAFEHSEFGLKFWNEIHKFPTERMNYEFVGDVFDENDIRNDEYWRLIEKYEKTNQIK